MFDISNDAADWIQDNLYLIDDGDLQQIVKKCPVKIVGEVLLAMDDVGAEIKEDPSSVEMWSIKSSDGYRTMSLGKHNKTNFNVNYTVSEGMRGGMQIGFKSVTDCIKFIKKLDDYEKFRPSRMQPKIVSEYTWQEVDTIYGKCWVTNLAIDKYDPQISAARNKLNRVEGKLNRDWYSILCDRIDIEALKRELDSRYQDESSIKGDWYAGEVSLLEPDKTYQPQLVILHYVLTDSDVNDILGLIEELTTLKPNICYKSTDNIVIHLTFNNDLNYIKLKDNLYANAGLTP